MAYPVLAVANRFLDMAQRQGKALDPLKLQKLIFLAHGWKLTFSGQPLIQEGFDAWQYGPVSPLLYREFKEFRANPITRRSSAPAVAISSDDEHLFSEILRVYGDKSGIDLSSLTHETGSAWRATYDGSMWSSPSIPDYLIKAEFDKKRADGRG